MADARDQLATERLALSRERAAVANARRNPQLRHVADSAMSAARPRLFEGKDDVMASAELASYLGDVARDTRVWLEDAATRPAVPATTACARFNVDIRAESDLLGTLMFLKRLERGDKLVRIERLDISRAPRSDEKDEETLSIAATIAGFAVAPAVRMAATCARRLRLPAVSRALGVRWSRRARPWARGWTTARAFRVEALPRRAASIRGEPGSIGRHGVAPPADVSRRWRTTSSPPIASAPASAVSDARRSVASSAPVAESAKPAVLGTVVATDGRSFATLQLGADQPKLAHVGDKVGDWVVRAIQRGKVVLISTAGTRAELTVPKPGT